MADVTFHKAIFVKNKNITNDEIFNLMMIADELLSLGM
jgi:hypothetical protein